MAMGNTVVSCPDPPLKKDLLLWLLRMLLVDTFSYQSLQWQGAALPKVLPFPGWPTSNNRLMQWHKCLAILA